MRVVAFLAWMMLPVLGAAYHYGPGQQEMLLDEVDRLVAQAQRSTAAERWADAEQAYEEALALLPADGLTNQQRWLRLERAKVQMHNAGLPKAHQELKLLLDETAGDETADPALFSAVRQALANSQYYMTWLMRLEGRPRADWEPEIEAARQTYRLLAEQSQECGDAQATERNQEDLESAIRLARMDLKELEGLPLPSQ